MKSKIKWEKVNIFLSIWASIATIISIILGYQVINNSKNNIVDGDNNGQMINTDSYYNQVFNNPQDYSENEILRQAEIAFDAKDYDVVRKLYTLDKVESNPIVFNNLGYMYANGLGMEKNVEIAVEYYDKAIKLGIKDSIINKFVVMVNNLDYDDDMITNFYDFTNENLKNKDSDIYKKFKEKNNQEINVLPDDYIKKYTHWEDTGKQYTCGDKSELEWSFYKIFYWVATIPTHNDKGYGQYQVWAEQDRNFELCDYFKDEFIRI